MFMFEAKIRTWKVLSLDALAARTVWDNPLALETFTFRETCNTRRLAVVNIVQ